MLPQVAAGQCQWGETLVWPAFLSLPVVTVLYTQHIYTAGVFILQGVRTQLFGQVRTAVARRLLHNRLSFGAAFLAMQQLTDDIGRLPVYSIRLDHTYHLGEFVELQVRHCAWLYICSNHDLVGMQQQSQHTHNLLCRQPCAHSSFRLDLWQPPPERSRCSFHISAQRLAGVPSSSRF